MTLPETVEQILTGVQLCCSGEDYFLKYLYASAALKRKGEKEDRQLM